MTASSEASSVSVRRAREEDYDWVVDLMEQTLAPYYDGDHRAHAHRIFDAHIQGGKDYVGHFSAGQYMFIAEFENQPVGVVHVVEKKQKTAKISPLIVSPDFRGAKGVGNILLKHAEKFAVELEARQLYCTVASTNSRALGFFLHKGFRITGTAKDHYKQGVDEHMLYKQLIDDSSMNAPNVSVVPFQYEKHAEEVRQLILNNLQGNFLGVDDAWVDVLFEGYNRRDSGDINTKYKIIYVAESEGVVQGVAGATPKKGNPIKLMPLVASTEAAFEALIVDLRCLLSDYGHKLYVHLVPAPWQVACLQRHSWQHEGLFPGGYAPSSVVQQWGLNMRKGDTPMRVMRIKRPYFDAIMAGQKTLEVRVGYDSIKRYRQGDLIQLETSQVTGIVQVNAIRTYNSFAEMLSVEPWEKIVPDVGSQDQAHDKLRRIYPQGKEALGVYVFEIEPRQ